MRIKYIHQKTTPPKRQLRHSQNNPVCNNSGPSTPQTREPKETAAQGPDTDHTGYGSSGRDGDGPNACAPKPA
eukprot:2382461-Amphidinium_carterae.2